MHSVTQKRRQPPDPTKDGLPSDVEGERLILGSVLLSAMRFGDVEAALTEQDFAVEIHGLIFRRMADMARRGERIDRHLLAQELRKHRELQKVGGLAYLLDLDANLPSLPDVSAYVRNVRALAVRRQAIFAADSIANRLLDASADLASIQPEISRLAESLTGDRDREPPSAEPSWPEMGAAAFHGVAGDLVRLLAPHTEADSVALLLQSLVAWGSLSSRGPYYQAEADHHFTNEFVVLVGVTSKGRKGTSLGHIRRVLGMVDEHWAENCLLGGIGSGEALIDVFGEQEHRACVLESEFARLLAVISREGSTISAHLRNAWDTGSLAIETRQKKVRVKGAHLSLVGHITKEELKRRLDATEAVERICQQDSVRDGAAL
jgi:hypothetical protein